MELVNLYFHLSQLHTIRYVIINGTISSFSDLCGGEGMKFKWLLKRLEGKPTKALHSGNDLLT